MTGMSAVDLTASIGTRYGWDRTSVRMVRTWERRAGFWVGVSDP